MNYPILFPSHDRKYKDEAQIIVDGTLEVLVGYDGPCWGFSFCQLEVGEVPWPVTLDTESDNSLVVEIHCDEDTPWEVSKCSSD
jgi:hypothetical protein